jgi:hypothetical protein
MEDGWGMAGAGPICGAAPPRPAPPRPAPPRRAAPGGGRRGADGQRLVSGRAGKLGFRVSQLERRGLKPEAALKPAIRQLYFHFVSYISNGRDRRNVVRSSAIRIQRSGTVPIVHFVACFCSSAMQVAQYSRNP